jgi:transposase-like protein
MECKRCGSLRVVKNGKSIHGHQRWQCQECRKTFGERDHRLIPEEKKQAAIAHYLEGVGLRAIERLVGVSHNSVINWVLKEVENKAIEQAKPGEVEWVEADEMWTYVSKKKRKSGCGGLLIVLPRESADRRSVIVAPKQPSSWIHSFLTELISSFVQTFGTPTELSSKTKITYKAKRTPTL